MNAINIVIVNVLYTFFLFQLILSSLCTSVINCAAEYHKAIYEGYFGKFISFSFISETD